MSRPQEQQSPAPATLYEQREELQSICSAMEMRLEEAKNILEVLGGFVHGTGMAGGNPESGEKESTNTMPEIISSLRYKEQVLDSTLKEIRNIIIGAEKMGTTGSIGPR